MTRHTGVAQAAGHEERCYEITVRGRLSDTLLEAFDGLTAAPAGADTVLVGDDVDQSALFGVRALIESLGLELLDVRGVGARARDPLADAEA